MKTTIVKIPYIIWNKGQPRFVPGPHMLAAGIASRTLKHDNGTWFSFEEAQAHSTKMRNLYKAQKAQGLTAPKLPALKAATPQAHPSRTLGQCFEDFFKLPDMQGKPIVEGKRTRQPLSPATVAGYERYQNLIERACGSLDTADTWNMPVALIGPVRMQKLINHIEAQSGLHQARHARGLLSSLWTKVAAKQPDTLKGLFLELEKMPTPEGRIRPWEPHEFWAMVTTAERMGRYDMADCMFWGLLHGDRQTDRLRPIVVKRTENHITIKHSKTGVETTKLLDPWLLMRFAGNAARRKPQTVQWPQLIIDETAGQPWAADGNWYAHVFAAIRKEAALTMPSLLNGSHGLGLRDQDLRDTNQTWLDRASVDPRTMQLIAGHSTGEKSALQKRHYVAANQDRMDKAVMALSAILTETAPKQRKEVEG